MSTDTVPPATAIPVIDGAELRQATTTVYYRAKDLQAFVELAHEHKDDPGFYRYHDVGSGNLSHFGWDEGGLHVCVWAPSEAGA